MSLTYNASGLPAGVLGTFWKTVAAQKAAAYVGELCETINSDGDQEIHEYLGQAAQMSAWVGTRTYSSLPDKSLTITNTTYDANLAFDEDHLNDNRTGSMRRRISQLATVAAGHVGKTIVTTLVTTNPTGYDGSALFSTTHAVLGDEGGTQSNLLTGAGATEANVEADYEAGREAMLDIVADNGEPFHADGVQRLNVMFGPALEYVMRRIFKTTDRGDEGFNEKSSDGVMLHMSPRITDNDWFLFTSDADKKPLILQPRMPLKSTTSVDYAARQLLFGVEQRYGVGAGLWQSIMKINNS